MGIATDILESYLPSWSHLHSKLQALFSTFIASPDPSGNIPRINELPFEILLIIFSCETDDRPPNYDLDNFPRKLPRRTLVKGKRIDPILLGHVCKYWRDITLNTPLLWSTFFVLCNLKPQMVELLRIWLERSADIPLDITFVESVLDIKVEDEYHNPPQNPITPQIMKLLTAHANRWKTIDFGFSLQISPVLFNLPPGSFKILETAKLRSRRATNIRFDGVTPLVKVWDLFHASPSLHTTQYELEYAEHKLREIPWSRLTCVDVIISMDDLFKILSECQNLVELRYTDPFARYPARQLVSDSDPTPEPFTPVVLPSLRHLSMVASRSPDEAFNNLTLPKLESVYLRQNNIWYIETDPCAFTNLLTRSQCHLKQFSYHGLGDPIAEQILGEMLVSPAMSSVVDLTVDVRVTEKFAELIAGPGKAVLPRLESFTLVRPSMEPGKLGEMISSLKEERETFQFFNAQYWDRYEVDRKKFSDLREKGLVIKD